MNHHVDHSRKSDPSQAAANHVPSMKARPAVQKKSAGGRGVVQLHLANDLHDKKFKVAIAGEIHDDIPVEQEKNEWKDVGIDLHHEAAEIPLKGGGKKVTPDPIELRLGNGYTLLMGGVGRYLIEAASPGDGAGLSGEKDITDVFNYILPTLIADLKALPGARPEKVTPIVAALGELVNLLKDNGLVKAKALEVNRRRLAETALNNLDLAGQFIHELHGASAFRGVKFESQPLQDARSYQMLTRIDEASAALENTIYKVGNEHVVDIRREKWTPKTKVAVLDKDEYLREYKTIPKKKAAVPVPSARPASALLPAAGIVVPGPAPDSKKAAKRKPKAAKPKAEIPKPAKSEADQQIEQIRLIMDGASAEVKKAKGYKALETALGLRDKTTAENIINEVRRIIKERNDRSSIVKKLFRATDTQQLYDNIATVIGG
ncbi:hypothetical protein [Dinghuibacter silviterrae]|uniref:Uncharacterized protein n=1 Tax=Dinghuibacter silviterrae TaxID=1539049 RepID=A0A4R8DQA7_9BACT|nr:hypothetical protein [Dinghuibacter silviterrae]TDX00314.1 hypothetical protein EDB95_1335 [Dinghuibacter silviterrae]